MKTTNYFRDNIFQINTETDRCYSRFENFDINRKNEEVLYVQTLNSGNNNIDLS